MPTPSARADLCEDFHRWRAGDGRAGRRLFATLAGVLRPETVALAGRVGGHEPMDLLHDAFAAFIEVADRFDATRGPGGIVGWFRVTLRRRASELGLRETASCRREARAASLWGGGRKPLI